MWCIPTTAIIVVVGVWIIHKTGVWAWDEVWSHHLLVLDLFYLYFLLYFCRFHLNTTFTFFNLYLFFVLYNLHLLRYYRASFSGCFLYVFNEMFFFYCAHYGAYMLATIRLDTVNTCLYCGLLVRLIDLFT